MSRSMKELGKHSSARPVNGNKNVKSSGMRSSAAAQCPKMGSGLKGHNTNGMTGCT